MGSRLCPGMMARDALTGEKSIYCNLSAGGEVLPKKWDLLMTCATATIGFYCRTRWIGSIQTPLVNGASNRCYGRSIEGRFRDLEKTMRTKNDNESTETPYANIMVRARHHAESIMGRRMGPLHIGNVGEAN